MLEPRRLFAPCSPMTHARASTTFDLPEPLGPTTQVIPGSRRSVVALAKDLNPRRDKDLRCTWPHYAKWRLPSVRAGACVLVVFVEAWLVRGSRPFRIVAALTALRSALSALDGYRRIGGSARCCSAAALGHHRNVALSKRLISIGGSNPRPGLALSSPRCVARASVPLRFLEEATKHDPCKQAAAFSVCGASAKKRQAGGARPRPRQSW